jgi:hypothetical protein
VIFLLLATALLPLAIFLAQGAVMTPADFDRLPRWEQITLLVFGGLSCLGDVPGFGRAARTSSGAKPRKAAVVWFAARLSGCTRIIVRSADGLGSAPPSNVDQPPGSFGQLVFSRLLEG